MAQDDLRSAVEELRRERANLGADTSLVALHKDSADALLAWFDRQPVQSSAVADAELPLDRWREWARRDDWHNLFVGSDIRQLVGAAERSRELSAAVAGAKVPLLAILEPAPHSPPDAEVSKQLARLALDALTAPAAAVGEVARWQLQFSNTPPSVTIWAALPGRDPRNTSIAYVEFADDEQKRRCADAFYAIEREHNAAVGAVAGPVMTNANPSAECAHPWRNEGPRVPLRYGSAATEVCGVCHAWRQVRETAEHWRPAASLAESFADVEEARPAAERDEEAALVARFSEALLTKLRASEAKYGYRRGWMRDDWRDELVVHLVQHVAKGDPIDVAGYCAFAWHHGWLLEVVPESVPMVEVANGDSTIAVPATTLLAGAARRILDADREAPDFGMCDCIDNTGAHYQSADLAAALIDARRALNAIEPGATSVEPAAAVEQPTALPVLKSFLRIEGDAEDEALSELIARALGECERFTGLTLLHREEEETLAARPGWQRLRLIPVCEVIRVCAVRDGGGRDELSRENHSVDIDANGAGWVRVLSSGQSPHVAVRFRAGMAAEWHGLPESLRVGVIRFAAHAYSHRGAFMTPPAAVTALWLPYRRPRT